MNLGLVILVFVIVFGTVCFFINFLSAKIPGFREGMAVVVVFATLVVWQMWLLSIILGIMAYGLLNIITKTQTPWGTTISCPECGCDVLDEVETENGMYKAKCLRCGKIHTWWKER